MKTPTTLLLTLLAVVATRALAHADPPVLSATRYTLPNGHDVLLAPDPSRAQIVVRMDYGAGLADDPVGYPESSHLVEHLLFRGTRHTRGSTTERLRAFGVSRANGFTEAERTSYVTSASSSQLLRILWLEGDRLAFGLDAITDDNVSLEREIVWREHVERFELSPYRAATALLHQAIYPPGHRRRAMASQVTVPDTLRLDAARWFFQQWYAPGNARLTVVGGFDAAVARAAIAQSFGDIPARAVPERPAPAPLEPLGWTPGIDLEARVDHGLIVLGWRTPAHRAPGDAELDVFRHFLESRVEDALRRPLRAVTAVYAMQYSAASGSHFTLTIELGRNVATNVVRGALTRALTQALQRCDESGWFEAARETELARYRHPPTDLVDRAADLARDRESEDPGGYVRDLARFTAVDQVGTCAAARRLLDPARSVALRLESSTDLNVPFRVRGTP